jgi:hypothetical protein
VSRRLLVGLLGLLGLGACSAIVGGPIDPSRPIACDPWAGDPCPPPYACLEGVCVVTYDACNGLDDDADTITDEGSTVAPPCEGDTRCVRGRCLAGCSNELCNGLDDDCDEMTDEGLDVDADADGVSACPLVGPPDCDDSNPKVYPANPNTGADAAAEVCNGLDDDCSSATTEDVVGICPGGVCQRLPGAVAPECFAPDDCRIRGCVAPEVCDATTNRCSAPPNDCRMLGMACPSPLVCDPADGTCDPPPLGAVGAACRDDSQCASGLCFTRASLGLFGSGGICGVACCDQSDCEPGQRCWTPGTGARSCVTAEVYGDLDAFACGSAAACPGAACLARTVTVNADGRAISFDGMFCGAPPFLGNALLCSVTECSQGLCLEGDGICAAPCERSDDCLASYPGWFRAANYTPVCGYVATDTSIFTACMPPPASGAGPGTTGSICSGNAECRDGLCVNGRCADVCCSDDNCPGDYRCAPIGVSFTLSGGDRRDASVMRCFPRATMPM